jgi:hypothetical protein
MCGAAVGAANVEVRGTAATVHAGGVRGGDDDGGGDPCVGARW